MSKDNDLWMIGGAYFSPKACDILILVRLRPIDSVIYQNLLMGKEKEKKHF